ncbi:MAG: MiaB/RimO family radical SAM methylthiotransferase [Oscillospiraceae bacterium]|jgi:threonylcarbamoyladenosine tRNA methylthiotransferase MtaB|nr:MiaB/RimO family radical SAM methylthiotransferase [Oscillospiraceae bacterium]
MYFVITTFGCKVNQYESSGLSELLRENGFTPAPSPGSAALHIINSCTVTENSDRKVRRLIKRVRKENPGAAVVLCGCFPKAFPEKARAAGADIVIAGTPTAARLPVSAQGERTRAFLKIQDGCDRGCAYCVIPKARGAPVSRALPDITAEAETLAACGHKEIVLTGINLSAYAADGGAGLTEAVGAVCAVPGLKRVRLSSLEPDLITKADITRLAGLKKLCPHFHLSLQSGSDAVLRRMNRRYDTAYYDEVVFWLREAFPGCSLTTDIIAGFPGETRAEFDETLAFAEKTGFAKIHAFAYSRREGTLAASMPGQVPGEVKRERLVLLRALADRLRGEFFARQTGGEREVLVEKTADGFSEGRAPDYTPVKVRGEFGRNEIVRVRITGVEGGFCLGEADENRERRGAYDV